MMRANILKLLLVAAFSLASAKADEILVITSPETKLNHLDSKQLKNIFLRKSQINAAGKLWIPVNLSPTHPVRLAFSQSLFHQLPDEMESYWNEQYFHGIAPPYVLASEEAMLRFVSSTEGAIGYILPCHLDKRVKVVSKLNSIEPLKPVCNEANH